MPHSSETINYSLRPAKHVERKMVCEAFHNLSVFAPVKSYRYVGFGAIYFADFHLFHKALNITNMVSIERAAEYSDRFEFNLPFSCIRMEYGESTEILPKLGWLDRTILWLDYDKKLSNTMLADIGLFCANAISGSVLLVTVNAHPDRFDQHPLRQLKRRVGESKVPPGVRDRDLQEWGSAAICRRIIDNEIKEALSIRNGALDPQRKFSYKQLFNFYYSDNAKMLTVGGLLYEDRDSAKVTRAGFQTEFTFIRGSADPFIIEVPMLTYRELRHLDSQLPSDVADLKSASIPEEDLQKYARLYRWFPTFADTEV